MSTGVEVFTVTDPAAAAQWTTTVPTGEQWELLSISAKLVTSAAAGNRRLNWRAKDAAGRVVVVSTSNTAVTASAAITMCSFPGSESVSWTSGVMNVGMPAGLVLFGGWVLESWMADADGNNTTVQAGDQWSNIVVRARVTR